MNTAADTEQLITPAPTAKSGGLKATWHLEIITGKEARTLLEMQNQAIIDLLTWVAEQEMAIEQNTDGCQAIHGNVSRGTFGLAA
jgi:hypothetical protein